MNMENKLRIPKVVEDFLTSYANIRFSRRTLLHGDCCGFVLQYKGHTVFVNSMEQTPSWEANSHSGSQEISRLSWDLSFM